MTLAYPHFNDADGTPLVEGQLAATVQRRGSRIPAVTVLVTIIDKRNWPLVGVRRGDGAGPTNWCDADRLRVTHA